MRALVLLALLVAAPAWGATFHLSPTGSGAGTRADSTTNSPSNPKTLAWFNANALKGDVGRLVAGVYSDPIQPVAAGTAGQRIYYYGDVSNPAGAVVTNVLLGDPGAHSGNRGSYVTVRWVRASQQLTFIYNIGYSDVVAHDDSLIRVTATSNDGFSFVGWNNKIDSLGVSGTCTDTGQRRWINMFYATGFNYKIHDNDMTNSTVNLTVNVPVSGGFNFFARSESVGTFQNNDFNVTVTAAGGYFFISESYGSCFDRVLDNRWNLVMNTTPAGANGLWSTRERGHHNLYARNTVRVTGSGTMNGLVNNSGTVTDLERNNHYTNNDISFDIGIKSGESAMLYYDDENDDLWDFNVIRTSASGRLMWGDGQPFNGGIWRHNTFVSGGATVIDFSGSTAASAPRLVSNIYYGMSANGSGAETVKASTGMGLDSSGVYFNRGGNPAFAIRYNGVSGAAGSGGSYGAAGKALWGSPMFVDSAYATFNATPTAVTSYALTASLFDSYAGAIGSGGTTTYAITVSAGANGAISPGSVSVASGDNQSFSIIPSAHYHVASATVDAVSQGAITSYAFTNVTATHTLSSTFALDQNTITASASFGGSISPTGAMIVNYGASQAYTITPASGKVIASVDLDGEPAGPLASYTFDNVTSPHYIQAFFTAAPDSFAIVASDGVGGSITPAGVTQVVAGGSQSYTITAFSGFHTSNVLVDGSPVGAVASYAFTNVSATHTIAATFADDAVPVDFVARIFQRSLAGRFRTRNR